MKWEVLPIVEGESPVRRLKIDGGHLYQVAGDVTEADGVRRTRWSSPIFVRERR